MGLRINDIAPDFTLLVSDEAAGGEPSITAYAYRP